MATYAQQLNRLRKFLAGLLGPVELCDRASDRARANPVPATNAALSSRRKIAREVLHRWASEQIHAASVMHSLLLSEGLPGITSGVSGNARESQGFAGIKGE